VVIKPEQPKQMIQAIAPKVFPRIPRASAAAAWVPPGYRAEVVARDLVYPTAITFDDRGNVYIAEAGYAYGDLAAPARVLRVSPAGGFEVVADQLTGPVTDILWNRGRLLISQRGKVSAVEAGDEVRDLVTDLPSYGDHHNNQLAVGPDGKIYVGQGSATNSGVVGLDNVYPYLWLTQYPDVFDVPPVDVTLTGVHYTTPDPLTVLARQGEMISLGAAVKHLLSTHGPLLVKTGAFQPFGKQTDRVTGQVKANGTILRMNPDGSGLEVFAWGLRNPFGLRFGPDGTLYATDNGYDERGSRPIANAPDCIWAIRQGGYYGFPDFSCGVPVTDARFRPTRGAAPSFLLRNHPPVERPVAVRPPHSAATKFDFARDGRFAAKGTMFVAEAGSGGVVTEHTPTRSGFGVHAIDLATGRSQPFLMIKPGSLGPKGYEHEATAGPRRPVDVRFSPDGDALYVVDFGAMAAYPAGAGPVVHPFPGSGVLWRIVRERSARKSPPTELSPIKRASLRGVAAGPRRAPIPKPVAVRP
jgi:glucose/arabinose dehydrogenase